MKQGVLTAGIAVIWAAGAAAHPGAHVHPHDGASWLAVAGALAVLALACGMALVRAGARK